MKKKTNNIQHPAPKSIRVENPRNTGSLYTSEFSGLTPDNVKYYSEARRKGLAFWWALLFEDIRRRDLHIGGVCQTRKLAVSNKEWQIDYKPGSDINETKRNETIQFIEKNFSNFNFTNFITDIVEAQIQGIVKFELVWEVDDKIVLKNIICIPNYLLLFDDINNCCRFMDIEKADVSKLRYLGWQSFQDRINIDELAIDDVEPLNILEAQSLDGNSQNGFMNGCIDGLIYAFLFKSNAVKDYTSYLERYGMPAVIGRYPAEKAKFRAEFEETIKNFKREFRAVLPNDMQVEFVTPKNLSGGGELFGSYIDYWDTKIAVRVLGQSLTTDLRDHGSFAAAKIHDNVRKDIIAADMLLVEDTVNKLIKRIIDLNEPNVSEYPEFHFTEESDIDYKQKRSTILRNLKEAGWTAKKEDIEKEFNVTIEN